MKVLGVVAACVAVLVFAVPATATPVATDDGSYQLLGRVFPDPLADCGNSGGVCSPNAKGNVPATQFIGVDEFVDALKYMNSKPEWQRYMEVLALDGKLGPGAGSGKDPDIPGNNLDPEWKPDPAFQSAGLPTSDLGRQKSDLMVVRVTDETVPDKGKKRYALSLSIHGIERAGAEGGTRAMEDLVTAATTGLSDDAIVTDAVRKGAPKFQDVLKKTIIYFTYPNPDGWRRGSVSSGGVFFQRYNGNGVDPNRDWPDIGFAFRGYSAVSEPETRAWISFYNDVRQNGGQFSAGDDLHGQPEADALSYTLLPHGRHRYDKNVRIQEAAQAINRSTYDRIKWSPIVQDNDAPHGGGAPCSPDVLGTACAKIYAQTWGSVYDTINYTTTGALGDWFDSQVGLGADGIDNEMSFSHLDKNITFDPHTEQLHVDGNKALIYAHLTQIIDPSGDSSFDVPGKKGYVKNKRVKRLASASQPVAPDGSVPQDDETIGPQPVVGSANFDFTVKRGVQPDGKNIFSGGIRVEATNGNAQGIGTGQVTLAVQCANCDEHPGVKDDDGYVTVAEDYNQSFLYAQAGVVATVNHPQAYGRDGKEVKWRAVLSGPAGVSQVAVHFTKGPASDDGDTGGGAPPEQRAYDVANTDFFSDLNPFIPGKARDLSAINPRRVIAGKQSLDSYDTIALADDPLPGYVGPYGDEEQGPTGPPTKDVEFAGSASAPGGGSGAPGTTEEHPFKIGPNDANSTATVRIEWDNPTMDFDLAVYRVVDGERQSAGDSGSAPPSTEEEVTISNPPAGDYIVEVTNYAAPDPTYRGSVKFAPIKDVVDPSKSTYTKAQKDAWFKKLRSWVETGGNLVLTDGALRALPELTAVSAGAVSKQTVYAGQSSFALSGDEGDTTLKDPLAKGINLQGARFNSGMRRQMYEPTPLGFAIQNTQGADASFARQYDVDRAAWEKAGGRTVAGSADAGARDASAVYSRVTIGELKLGGGDIRIAGALLPQATEDFDHQYGLEPYSTTYTGYIIARNLLQPQSVRAGGRIGGRFVISRRAVKLRGRTARVRVSCRTPLGCKGTLRLAVKVRTGKKTKKGKRRTKMLRIGSKKFNYPKAKKNAVIRVKLNKRGVRIATHGRRDRVYATAPMRFTDGRKATARRAFWLYRPSRRR